MTTQGKYKTNAQETAAVKKALARARIPVKRVFHSTSGIWLRITLKKGYRGLEGDAMRFAKVASGRKGQYDGRIGVDTAV